MIKLYRPSTLEAALTIRAAEDVAVLAGGTDILPAKIARQAWGDTRHNDVLDISRIEILRGVIEQSDRWRIGAMTTWSELLSADLPPLFDGLKKAARVVGGVQIQNRGTLIGNICTASPAGDGIPILLSLDANVDLVSLHGTRTTPLHDFIDGYRHTNCRNDEIVVAITIPKPRRRTLSNFTKLGARAYLVISIAMVAGVIELTDNGTIAAARIAVGACSPVAQRLASLEAILPGTKIADAADAVIAAHFANLQPLDDIRASAQYRRHAAMALTKDLLSEMHSLCNGRID